MNRNINKPRVAYVLLALNCFMLLDLYGIEARDRGDDIIMTKGKLIMRGGKGKGNLILDTGSKSSESMIPMHFNPYSFYPMHHHQPQHHHQPPMIIHPIYIEDHSAMHHQQHHEEPQYHHHEQQHHEPQHHEVEYQHHHEPLQHEMHHEHEQHHQPMEHHQHYEQEEGYPHHEQESHGGYENHPMVSMMMHGSGLQPAIQQVEGLPHPIMFANPFQGQSFQQQQEQTARQNNQAIQKENQASESNKSNKQPTMSLLNQAANNPLVEVIKPLFKRTPKKVQEKKP